MPLRCVASSLARPRTSKTRTLFTSSRWSRCSPGSGSAPTASRRARTAPTRPSAQLGEHTGLAVFLGARDGADRLHHQLRLQPHHRAVPVGRRRLRRRHASCSARASGVVSGAALLVDYVLTITISIASGADAIFSFLPPAWLRGLQARRSRFVGRSALLTMMNLRGVKESVTALVPIFVIFLVTHAIVLIVLAIGGHVGEIAAVTAEVTSNVSDTFAGARHVRHAEALRPRVFARRRHLHRDRGRLQRRRASCASRGSRPPSARWCSWPRRWRSPRGGILLCYLLVHADARRRARR